MKKILALLVFSILPAHFTAYAQNLPGNNKVDLGDVQIKGELLSDKRLGFSSREKNYLTDQIKLRTNFRDEMLEELPPYFKSPEVAPASATAGK